MPYAITNVKIVTPFRIVENAAIVIDGKSISELGKMEDVSFGAWIPRYDFSGMTVTPGFVDLLVHGGEHVRGQLAGFAEERDFGAADVELHVIEVGLHLEAVTLHDVAREVEVDGTRSTDFHRQHGRRRAIIREQIGRAHV